MESSRHTTVEEEALSRQRALYSVMIPRGYTGGSQAIVTNTVPTLVKRTRAGGPGAEELEKKSNHN